NRNAKRRIRLSLALYIGEPLTLLSLTDYSTLLEKCISEFEELEECSSHPKRDYLIFNIVMGMNHLFEWFLLDENVPIDLRVKCVKTFNPYAEELNPKHNLHKFYSPIAPFPSLDNNQKIIRELCNRAKHFKTKPAISQDKHFINGAGEAHMQCGEPLAVCGSFDYFNYYVEAGDVEIELTMVLKAQIDRWSEFISSNV
ncbi:hypothetical protein, partial [Aliikangiella maris]